MVHNTSQVEGNDNSNRYGSQSGDDVFPVFLNILDATSSYITEFLDLLILELKPCVLSEH